MTHPTRHGCRFLLQQRSPHSVDPTWANTIGNMLNAMLLTRRLSIFDEAPAERVRADATQLGVSDTDPAGLLAYTIEKWLRLALRYVTGEVILLPLNTERVWGRRIGSEIDLELAVRDLLLIADRFNRAYQSKYAGKDAWALVVAWEKQRSAIGGLTWPWNDEEDMVARIANAHTAQVPEEQELPEASAQERAVLREHFRLGFDVSEIIDHLGLAPHIAFEEYAAWREAERIARLDRQGGDAA